MGSAHLQNRHKDLAIITLLIRVKSLSSYGIGSPCNQSQQLINFDT